MPLCSLSQIGVGTGQSHLQCSSQVTNMEHCQSLVVGKQHWDVNCVVSQHPTAEHTHFQNLGMFFFRRAYSGVVLLRNRRYGESF